MTVLPPLPGAPCFTHFSQSMLLYLVPNTVYRYSILGRGWIFLSSPPRPKRLWGPPSLLSSGYQGLFPRGKTGGAWSWPLTSIYCRG